MATKSEEWEEKVQRWRASGQSAAAWCRENEISYCQFLYWRERLLGPTKHFVELTDPISEDSGIAIEVKGTTLRLKKSFDQAALLSCLKLLSAC